MRLDRREFIMSGAIAGAAFAAGGAAGEPRGSSGIGPLTKPPAKLNLSSQEWIIPGKDLKEKLAHMEAWGFDGFEVGGGGLANRVKEIRDAMAGSRLRISAVCAGYSGALISDDENERKKAVQTIKEILIPAGELGSTGLIVVPAFNNQTKLPNNEARKILLDLLPELGEFAAAAGTRILLEPLNRSEAFFLRQLADAAAICRDAGSIGVRMMGDFYHMNIEETSDLGAILSAGQFIHHVHLASRKRNLPGQDERDFTSGFRGLKMIGYRDFCSLECGVLGDRMVEIPKAVKFLRRQWEQA